MFGIRFAADCGHRRRNIGTSAGGGEILRNAQKTSNNTILLYPIHAKNAIAEFNKFHFEISELYTVSTNTIRTFYAKCDIYSAFMHFPLLFFMIMRRL